LRSFCRKKLDENPTPPFSSLPGLTRQSMLASRLHRASRGVGKGA
jgi:hypothetical protein